MLIFTFLAMLRASDFSKTLENKGWKIENDFQNDKFLMFKGSKNEDGLKQSFEQFGNRDVKPGSYSYIKASSYNAATTN